MSTNAKRERWTDGKQDQLYEKYFTPLLTDSSLEYLEALYQQQYYKSQYIAVYVTSDRNSQQRTPTDRCKQYKQHTDAIEESSAKNDNGTTTIHRRRKHVSGVAPPVIKGDHLT